MLAATFCPLDGHASPEAVVQGYAAGARAFGASVVTGCGVDRIVLDGQEVRGVETTLGTDRSRNRRLRRGRVVSRASHARRASSSRCSPISARSASPARRRGFLRALPLTIDFSTGFYFHREGPGLLFGMADPDQPPGLDAPTDPEWLSRVFAVAERRCPMLLEMGIAGGWKGAYEVTPDHNALVGESREVERLLYATGFSGHGFLQGPAVGEIVRDLVLGHQPFVDVSPLSVERFADAAPRPEHNVI